MVGTSLGWLVSLLLQCLLPTPVAGDPVPGVVLGAAFPTMASVFSATLFSMDSPSLHPEETESVDIVPAVSLRSWVVVTLGGLVLCNSLKWGIV